MPTMTGSDSSPTVMPFFAIAATEYQYVVLAETFVSRYVGTVLPVWSTYTLLPPLVAGLAPAPYAGRRPG